MGDECIKKEDAIQSIIAHDLVGGDARGWAEYLLENAPTIDAVPVIRCKNCRWFGKMGCAIEVVDETDMPKENDFCSFAERRDDETDRCGCTDGNDRV